jgi:hypothetical protein
MSIEARTVSDSQGRIADYMNGNDKVSIEGTIKQSNIYTFYAVNTPETDVQEITLVLPVGGSISGIYRFPRVGEKVLVEMGTSGNYLLGYIPSEGDNPFAPVENNATVTEEKNKLLDTGQGMAIRYRQTGKTSDKVEAGEEYSEIGFYHELTQWKPKSAEANNYANVSTSGDEAGFPKIDRINIQSTGDIHSDAANHHMIKAKRLELLVNEEPEKHKEEEGEDKLLVGDMRIKTGNRITIEAGNEIELKVGRSSITISDRGIELTTSQGHRTSGPWDTTIELDARGGLSMFGSQVEIGSVFGFEVTDSFGSSIGSELGAIGLSSSDINIETNAKYMQILHVAATAAEMTWAVSQVSRSLVRNTDAIEKAMPALQGASGLVRDIGGNIISPDDDEGFELFALVLKLIIQIVHTTLDIIDVVHAEKQKDPSWYRDQLNLSAITINWGLVTIIQVGSLINAPSLTGDESKISVGREKITITGRSLETITVQNYAANSATAGTGFLDKLKKWAPTIINTTSGVFDTVSDLVGEYVDPYIKEELKEL